MRATNEQRSTPIRTDELRLAAHASKLELGRAYARQLAAGVGFDEPSCDEFVFAVNEAMTNAIRHGAPDEYGQISISAVVDGERLTLRVRDYGTFVGCAPNTSALAESGRGFALMTRLTDAVQVSVGKGATTVHLSKRVRDHAAPDTTR